MFGNLLKPLKTIKTCAKILRILKTLKTIQCMTQKWTKRVAPELKSAIVHLLRICVL